jgi:type I restriction enzyme R subunit
MRHDPAVFDVHDAKYYEKMSQLLDALIEQRKKMAIDYQKYLEKIVELTKKAKDPIVGESYPKALNTPAKRALYDNLGKDEGLALAVDNAVRTSKQDDWRSNSLKTRRVKFAIKNVLKDDETLAEQVLELVKNQHEY